MKPLLTLIFLFFFTLTQCQIYKGTGTDITIQYNQVIKTNDSLKTALTVSKASVTSLNIQVTTLQPQLKTKSDSILLLKNQVKSLNDSLLKYKALTKTYNYSLDTLKKRLNNILNPTGQMDSLYLASFKTIPTTTWMLNDTASKSSAIVSQKIYDVVPVYRLQTLYRLPIQTTQGIKTKEIIITEK